MTCLPHYCTQNSPKMTPGPWMSKIADEKLVSEMTIPGTHDSGCMVKLDFVQTQSYTISTQLDAGVRFFDIRCRHISDAFAIHHGPFYCNLNFGDVLNAFIDFLTKNPSECILMRVKEEYDADKCTRSFNETFEEYYKAFEDWLILEKKIPTLGELRKKIYVFCDFDNELAMKWSACDIQDDWSITTIFALDEKKEEIKNQINKAINGISCQFYANFCSGAGVLCYPYTTANSTNSVPMSYQGRLGIIICDFPGEELIQHLINQN